METVLILDVGADVFRRTVSLIGMIFFLPETMYDRPSALKTDVGHGAKEAAAFEKAEHELAEKSSEHQMEDVEASTGASYLPAKTLLQEMKPWSGYIREYEPPTIASP